MPGPTEPSPHKEDGDSHPAAKRSPSLGRASRSPAHADGAARPAGSALPQGAAHAGPGRRSPPPPPPPPPPPGNPASIGRSAASGKDHSLTEKAQEATPLFQAGSLTSMVPDRALRAPSEARRGEPRVKVTYDVHAASIEERWGLLGLGAEDPHDGGAASMTRSMAMPRLGSGGRGAQADASRSLEGMSRMSPGNLAILKRITRLVAAPNRWRRRALRAPAPPAAGCEADGSAAGTNTAPAGDGARGGGSEDEGRGGSSSSNSSDGGGSSDSGDSGDEARGGGGGGAGERSARAPDRCLRSLPLPCTLDAPWGGKEPFPPVLLPVPTGHISSLPPYQPDASRPSPRTNRTHLVPPPALWG